MNTKTLSQSDRSLRNAGHGLRAFLAILATILLGATACHAAGSGVLDNGTFFSEQAKSDAGKVIAEVERTLHKDIAVETFKEIPADLKAGVNVQDKTALNHLFQQWAEKQAKEKRVNGIYLLLVKEPAHLQALVGNDTQRLAFTVKDRDALVSLMLGKLRAQQKDEALRDGVNFIFATMKSHTNPRAHTGTAPAPVTSHPSEPSGTSGGWGWVIPAIVIGLVVWVVIGLFRALSGRMGGGSAMGQAGGGGGGFFSSLIGGMFGAAAGMWMYDQFFSNHGNSAYGADHNDQTGGDSGFTGQDTDYNSDGGGDFGGDSGGGSDSGGGDFGGGDSGGGGDF
jgi:uncharacterized membrane protein YgcG